MKRYVIIEHKVKNQFELGTVSSFFIVINRIDWGDKMGKTTSH